MVPGQVDTFFLNTHFTHRYFYGLGPDSHLHFYFLVVKPKLYIPSTLNIALLQWHTHLNVCAVK